MSEGNEQRSSNLVAELRETGQKLRRTPVSLKELIPLHQRAADEIERLTAKVQALEATLNSIDLGKFERGRGAMPPRAADETSAECNHDGYRKCWKCGKSLVIDCHECGAAQNGKGSLP